jgi:uncharacterized heparinase superfamily protein
LNTGIQSEAWLFFETARHLKLSQLLWRAVYNLRKPRQRKFPQPEVRRACGIWQRPLIKPESSLGDLRFRFLNLEHTLDASGDWNDPGLPKLWLYNLHYFDWLQSASATEDAPRQHSLMRHWVSKNPFGKGNGWEPYPLSLRIANWVKFALATGGLPRDLATSLAIQADYLSRRIEYHLLGNHLMANAKGLLFAGWFFRGSEADRWARKGIEVLRVQLEEQILPDGGHFERSAMYHSIILEDMLDVVNLARTQGQPVPPAWTDAIARMRRWLQAMTHSDGLIALFNDAAFDIAASPSELEAYAQRLDLAPTQPLPSGLLHLADTGYFRWQAGPWLLIGNIGNIGPAYQAGHSHADTLSFELSLGPHRLIVDSGTSTYAIGADRMQQRSTPAHNTVTMDGRNSSEVWSSFRVARRARICELKIPIDNSFVCAAHDGYSRLPGAPLHRRTWRLEPDALVLTDDLTGQRTHSVALAFHFHPAAKVILHGSEVIGSCGDSTFQAALPPELAWTIERTTWHPRFGESSPTAKLIGKAMLSLPCRLNTRLSLKMAS